MLWFVLFILFIISFVGWSVYNMIKINENCNIADDYYKIADIYNEASRVLFQNNPEIYDVDKKYGKLKTRKRSKEYETIYEKFNIAKNELKIQLNKK